MNYTFTIQFHIILFGGGLSRLMMCKSTLVLFENTLRKKSHCIFLNMFELKIEAGNIYYN